MGDSVFQDILCLGALLAAVEDEQIRSSCQENVAAKSNKVKSQLDKAFNSSAGICG